MAGYTPVGPIIAPAAGGGGSSPSGPDWYQTGRWYGDGYVGTPGLGSEFNLYLAPFRVLRAQAFDKIGLNITAAAVGTAVVLRYGIYSGPVGAATNMALVVDAGTVSAMATGEASITIAKTLQPGLYWLCAVVQGTAVTTAPSFPLRGSNSIGDLVWPSSVGFEVITDQRPPMAYRQTTTMGTVTGALAATVAMSSLVSYTSFIPDTRLRAG